MNALPNFFCPQCGTLQAAGTQVCSACGAWLPQASAVRPAQPVPSSYPLPAPPAYATGQQTPAAPAPSITPPYSNPPYGQTYYGPPPVYSYPPMGSAPYPAPVQQGLQPAQTQQFPAGVIALAVLVCLQAFDNLLSFGIDLLIRNFAGGIFAVLLVAADIVLVRGLVKLRPWAFWMGIAYEGFYLLIGILLLFISSGIGTIIERTVIAVLIPLAVLICLPALPNVRRAFFRK
jgi:hypothetical protein